METQVCSKCGEEKALDDFGWRNKSKGVKHKRCKSCMSAYGRQHYENNKPMYIEKARRWDEANGRSFAYYRDRAREFVSKYLETHPCVDCGETDPIVLEFDHVRGEKSENVSVMVKGGYSLEKIEAEIAKCEVRCANCHREKTHRQNGSWIVEYTEEYWRKNNLRNT